MKHFSVVLFALLGSLATAQIDDARAIALARPFVERFAPEASGVTPGVTRKMTESASGQTLIIEVSFEEVFVRLSGTGEFKSFVNLSRGRPVEVSERDKYPTDEEAWQALEAILADFEVPDGLTRTELVRNAPGGVPHIMRFRMLARPFGYEAMGGNSVTAEIHQKTGRLDLLRITRGWTYEPPNIRISREQAVDATRRRYGGEPQEWQVSLRYRSFAKPDVPEYVRGLSESKTMRLFYALWGPRGEVRIDSVTGEIIDFISPDQVANDRGKSTGSAIAKKSVTEASASPLSTAHESDVSEAAVAATSKNGATSSSPSVLTLSLLIAGAFALVSGIMFLLYRGWASRRAMLE